MSSDGEGVVVVVEQRPAQLAGTDHKDPRIDAAVRMLEELDAAAVDRHPAIYAQVDDRLREALATRPQPNGPSGAESDPSRS